MACRRADLFGRVHGGPGRGVEDVAVADDGGGPALVLELELADFVAGSEGRDRFWGFAADIMEVQVRVWAHWGGGGGLEGNLRG